MLDSYRENLPNLPVCCVGVQLNLAIPDDSTDVRVLVDGNPHPSNQVTRNGCPTSDLTTPISGSAEVALGPGTYSVTVTVTNQHGSTTSAPQQVTIPGQFKVESFIIWLLVLSVVFSLAS